jgi:dTDP-4-dehydrorhamnose 3,5-epimerase
MSIEFDLKESFKIKGVWILTPTINKDDRGDIWTSFLKKDIERLIPADLEFNHDKFSQSRKNVLRGIHGDNKSWKLVTCVYGEIYQVVVDCRRNSPTYLQWESFKIDKDNQKLILIPPNMGNSYCVLSNTAVYHYKLAYKGSYIDANDQFNFKWNSKKIGIDWPVKMPILSKRDE